VELGVSVPTISGQVSELEDDIGQPLFRRQGRGRQLSDTGQLVFDYAERIFGLGKDLTDALLRRPGGLPGRLVVGIADAVPKLVARSVIEPALKLSYPMRLVCRQDKHDRLVAELAAYELDVVISDQPAGTGARATTGTALRAFNHMLGECGISMLAPPALARRLKDDFPRSLDGVPMYMPTVNTPLRAQIDAWLDSIPARPVIEAEFEDSAMLKTFGQLGHGVFPVATVIETEACRQYHVTPVGRVKTVRERFYALTVQRRIIHPAVALICGAARHQMFAGAT